MIFVREYIGKNHENSERDKRIHIVNHIFACEIEEEDKYELEPDPDQVGIEWLKVEELEKYNFYPKDLIKELKLFDPDTRTNSYIGDMN